MVCNTLRWLNGLLKNQQFRRGIAEVEKISPIKYKQLSSEKLGRYLVAAKKISCGEVILREQPVAVGPALFNKNLLCYECLRVLATTLSTRLCPQCRVGTFCSAACEVRRVTHTPEECKILAGKVIEPVKMRSILLPLRLKLIQEQNPELWVKILQLEDHKLSRKDTQIWDDCQKDVVDVFKCLEIAGEQDTEILQRLCGILDVNSFELRSPASLEPSPLRGLFVQAALIAHDCRGNTYLTVDDDFQLTIYANKEINDGEAILFNYTDLLLGTAERREHLRKGKYFTCECKLCQDPNELGANLSTIICPRCRNGLVVFKGPAEVNPYVNQRHWKCQKCSRLFSGRLIKTCLVLAKSSIDQLDNAGFKDLEDLLKRLSSTLHPNHFLMMTLKQKLLAEYRSEVAAVNPSKKILQNIINLCKEILEVLDIVEPGISRLKGILLYEVHLPMVILANKTYALREISLADLIKKLQEAESCLKKCLTMLLLEPATTPEGCLAKRALMEYKALRVNLKDVQSLEQSCTYRQKTFKKLN